MANRSLRQRVTIAPDQNEPVPSAESASLLNFMTGSVSDFPGYASKFLKIQTKVGDLVDFEINEIQQIIEDIMADIRKNGRLIRILILKARRKGISTYVSGRWFWKTTTTSNHYSMIVTHEPEATDFIFKMHKRFLDHLPAILKPAERYNNKKVLEFNTEDGKGLDSAIRVGTADKEDFGSGQLIHNLHLSELAKYPKHNCTALLLSLLQCVPESPDTEIIMESTAKGIGGEFYDRYWGARYRYEVYLKDGVPAFKMTINEDAPEDNEYSCIFIPWFVFHEYRRDPGDHFVPTEEELKMKQIYGIDDSRLAWRRWTLVNKCNNDINLFNQEYPPDAMSAFLSSSDNVFDVQKLQERIKIAPLPKARYTVNLATGIFGADQKGKFHVWEEPILNRQYLISLDPAEGIVGRDPSSLDVFDVFTGRQVAHFNAIISPDQFGFVAAAAGHRYGRAQIVVERNNHGIAVIDKLIYLNYPKLYAEMIIEPPARPRKRYGWVTTKKSKPMVIDNLVAEFRDNLDGINCRETLEEMLFFKQTEDMQLEAEVGHRDDRVMSYANGKYVISKLPMKNRSKVVFGQPTSYTKQEPVVSSGAWS